MSSIAAPKKQRTLSESASSEHAQEESDSQDVYVLPDSPKVLPKEVLELVGKTVWAYAYSPTYQEPAIMYLTGINQNNVILLLDPKSKVSTEILFVSRKDRIMEFWEGVRFGVGDKASLQEVQSVTGIKDVRDIGEFKEVLRERFVKNKKKSLATFWYEGIRKGRKTSITTDHNYDFKKKLAAWLREWKAPKGALKNIMASHFYLRLPLDKYDIKNARKAQEITGEGFRAMLKNFSCLLYTSDAADE